MDVALRCRCLLASKVAASGLAREMRSAGYGVDLKRTGLDLSRPWDLIGSKDVVIAGAVDHELAVLAAMAEAHGGVIDGVNLSA